MPDSSVRPALRPPVPGLFSGPVLTALILAGLVAPAAVPAAGDPVHDASRAIERIHEETGGTLLARVQPATGVARLLRFAPGSPGLDVADKSATPEGRARVHLERFGDAFGIRNPDEQLEFVGASTDALGTTRVEYRQVHSGVEVFGATVRVHFGSEGTLSAIQGTFVPDLDGLSPVARVSEDTARHIARTDVGQRSPRKIAAAAVGARLLVFRANLARGTSGLNHLAWEIEVQAGPGVREFVYVDAHKGQVIDRISGIHEALDRQIYDGGFSAEFLVWSEGDAVPTADADIDNLIDFAEDTYNVFSSMTDGAYLSFDGADAVMHSVNNSPFIGCPNASWNGVSTNYCSGVTGDDTVAHEWAHAYTQKTHGLIYQWQPGALNESYSDIWGEIVDFLNGAGTDSPVSLRGEGECSTLGRGPAPQLTVDGPVDLAGNYFAAGAGFNPAPPVSVSADVEVAFDGDDADACQALSGFTAGNIALVDRGACSFTIKVQNAQNAGATGVLVVNTSDGAFSMGGSSGSINIPALMIGLGDGALIRNASGTVSATISLQSATETSWRWLAGEDDPSFGGAIRDMWTPTCYGDPGKVSDLEYQCSTGDSGGVHTNSGVPNHAFALLIDGGSFNGRTVVPISLVKAARIYWRAQSVYQGLTTDFPAHADALEMACADLTGAPLFEVTTETPIGVVSGEVIDAADCAAVAEAIAAVEFRNPPSQCDFVPLLAADAPPLCDGSDEQVTIAAANFEAGLGGWTAGTRALANPATFDTPDWAVVTELPSERAGSAAFVADLRIGDCQTDLEAGVLFLESPDIAIPTGVDTARLAFEHWVSTEKGWDGGNVKISVGGAPWALLGSEAFTFNTYPATLNESDNPLMTEPAFTGSDGGTLLGSWAQSQVDLEGIASGGDTIRLRFEMGLDGCNGVIGWYVDDVTVFSCAACAAGNWYEDGDGDSYGNAGVSLTACSAPAGFVADAQDCNDADATINPGAAETCNDAIDNDCNPATVDLFDTDADAFACNVDCDDADPSAWSVPGEVRQLTFADPGTLSWQAPALPGGSGIAYDVLRSSVAVDFDGAGVCSESGDTDAVYSEMVTPVSGEVWHYLVRAANTCPGSGSLGATSAGSERTGLSCFATD